MTYYQYQYNQVVADNGWKILLLLGREMPTSNSQRDIILNECKRKSDNHNCNADDLENDSTAQKEKNKEDNLMRDEETRKYYSHWSIKYQKYFSPIKNLCH